MTLTTLVNLDVGCCAGNARHTTHGGAKDNADTTGHDIVFVVQEEFLMSQNMMWAVGNRREPAAVAGQEIQHHLI